MGGANGPLGSAMGGQMMSPEQAEAQNQARLRTFESRFSQEPADPTASKVGTRCSGA